MPEGVEIEYYRRAANAALDREISGIDASDDWFLKEGTTEEAVHEALLGQAFVTARRIGKLLVLDLNTRERDESSHSGGEATEDLAPTQDRLGLRFGMTGRLLVDNSGPIEYLEYSSHRDDPAWDRFIVHFLDGGELKIRDPRRLGGVILNPDEGRLGPDLFELSYDELRNKVLVGSVALKSRLLDQRKVAGIGNLIADETMWQAGLDPQQPASGVSATDAALLLRALQQVLSDFLRDGGSHTGELQSSRRRGGQCPKDGAELDRRTIGGRTTYSCPLHQRISG